MERLTLANISKYLTEEVIEKVFKLKTCSDDNVRSVEVARAAKAGEGLISAVYRIKVTGNQFSASFIAKGLVSDVLLRKTLNCAILFKREARFFSEVLPVLIKIQKTLGGKERIQEDIPVCYGCHIDGENDYILMEDLSEKDFASLSENPTKSERDAILKVLAHFHSVSLALRLEEPATFTKMLNALHEVYYNQYNKDWYVKFLQEAIKIDRTVLLEAEGETSIYYKKYQQVVKGDVYEHLIQLATAQSDHMMISHGDAWCPNFLYHNGKAATIDFQLLRCASPANDLSCFIIMCSNLCRNKKEFNEAVNVYYKAFQYYLKDMGFDAAKIFSFNTLEDELIKYGKFGLLAALTSLPLLASERCDVLQSFEERFSGYDRIPLEQLWKLTPMSSPEDKKRLVNAVRVAVDVGLI